MFFPQLSFGYTILAKVLFALVISGASFGFSDFRKLIKLTLIFCAVSFTFAEAYWRLCICLKAPAKYLT
jgi:hypothetical protein